MAYNTQALKRDVNGAPTPQYFNPTADAYEVLQGSGGGANFRTVTLSETFATGVKTVTDTPTELYAGAAVLSGRYMLVIYNASASTIYIGDSSVTTSTGFPILPGDTFSIRMEPSANISIYAVTASSAVVNVMELK